MQVKFLQDVCTAIGPFVADQIYDIEDDYTRNNWIENGLCEPVKPVKRAVKKDAD